MNVQRHLKFFFYIFLLLRQLVNDTIRKEDIKKK